MADIVWSREPDGLGYYYATTKHGQLNVRDEDGAWQVYVYGDHVGNRPSLSGAKKFAENYVFVMGPGS